MTLEEARAAVGGLVMSRDPGNKLVRDIGYWHGPYRLLKVTKAGLCLLEGREQYGGVLPRLITWAETQPVEGKAP